MVYVTPHTSHYILLTILGIWTYLKITWKFSLEKVCISNLQVSLSIGPISWCHCQSCRDKSNIHYKKYINSITKHKCQINLWGSFCTQCINIGMRFNFSCVTFYIKKYIHLLFNIFHYFACVYQGHGYMWIIICLSIFFPIFVEFF